MATKYFINQFAVNGDLVEISDTTNSDGTVSYQQGYGFDYQRDLKVDDAAKCPDRLSWNGILSDITGAIIQYQQNSVPAWQSFQTYPTFARVRYAGLVFESTINNNVGILPITTEGLSVSQWAWVQGIGNYALTSQIPTQAQADWAQSISTAASYIKNKPTNVSSFSNDAGYLNLSSVAPYLSGHSFVTTATALTSAHFGALIIATTSGAITLPPLPTTGTSQSITIINFTRASIVVGVNNTSSEQILSPINLVGATSFTIPASGIAKFNSNLAGTGWAIDGLFMPALGMGYQSWQDVSASRASGATYTNTTGSPIMLCVTFPDTSSLTAIATASVNGVTIFYITYDVGSQVGNVVQTLLVPAGATYRVFGTVGFSTWMEFR